MLTFEQTTNLESQTYKDALMIRNIVFVGEQEVPVEIEIDDKEAACLHIVAYTENKNPIATGRLYPISNHTYKVQRVAVLKEERGKGFGKTLMQGIEMIARNKNAKFLRLGAQNQALPFYQHLGYHVISEEYEEAGILHHDVEKALNLSNN